MRNSDSGQNRGEVGAALVTALMAMLLITVIAAAIVSAALISGTISTNFRQQSEAYFISEAGLTHAVNLVSKAAATNADYTAILQAGNGVAGTGDELSTRPAILTPIPAAGLTLGNGSYTVSVFDDPADADGFPNVDSNKRLLIVSVGRGRDGSTATTEAVLAVTDFPAILVNGNLLINGNPSVTGSSGGIHANGTITVSGNPCAQFFNSTSTVTVGGTVRGSGCAGAGPTNNNQAIVALPTWHIQNDFRSRADYILGADGTVRNQAGNLQTMSGNDWNMPGGGKWTWDSGNALWVHGGGIMPSDMTFYAAGNMELGSDFGTTASPKRATFVAEGSITISANPIVTAWLDTRFAFMAGKDLTLNGNPASGYSSAGIHYAKDQIKFNGNPRIDGVVIAANTLDTNSPGGIGNPVVRVNGGIEWSGNAIVNYNGGLMDETPRILSWREVRN